MVKCYYPGCKLDRKKRSHFFSLPSIAARENRQKWLDILGLSECDIENKRIFVCDKHFDDASIEKKETKVELGFRWGLVKGAVPKCQVSCNLFC